MLFDHAKDVVLLFVCCLYIREHIELKQGGIVQAETLHTLGTQDKGLERASYPNLADGSYGIGVLNLLFSESWTSSGNDLSPC